MDPLVLTGHGLSIRVDKGCLLVRDGNTHYPAERHEWRFFNGALDIPPAFIVVDGSGEITIDAIDWLATQRVPLIRARWNGEFASIVTTGGQAASADKAYWQERTRNDPIARLRFARDLIRDKALSTLVTMEEHVPRSPVWEPAYKNPTIGIMHDRESDRGSYPAFALDQMEPMRPMVDRAVLHLIADNTFAGSDFSIQPDGVCRLNSELARRIAQLATKHLSRSISPRMMQSSAVMVIA